MTIIIIKTMITIIIVIPSPMGNYSLNEQWPESNSIVIFITYKLLVSVIVSY